MATLARKVKAHEVTRENFEAKLAEIEQDWRIFIQIELTLQTVSHAWEAAAEFALRGADAVHFSALRLLQQRVASSGHQVVLVASDRELQDAAVAQGIPIIDPESDPAT